MANNYGTYGAAAGSIFGAFTASMQIDAQNDAIAAEAQYNVDLYNSQEMMTKFTQDNNIEMMNNIKSQLESEAQEALRTTGTQATKAISQTAIKRGEGITAGASVQRSVDDIIKKADAVKAGQIESYEAKASDLINQVTQTNAAEQIKLINSYNNIKIKNEQLAVNVITGLDAALKIGQSAVGQAMQGYQTGNSIGNMINTMPTSPNIAGTGPQTMVEPFDTNNISNPFGQQSTIEQFKIQ